MASGLRQVPGAEQVGKAAGGALDAIGAVSPRGRRMAVYAGAGVLGVARPRRVAGGADRRGRRLAHPAAACPAAGDGVAERHSPVR
ncbi:hypothetical protein ACR6C2_44110 [Streptomyces sp. INA 01156]